MIHPAGRGLDAGPARAGDPGAVADRRLGGQARHRRPPAHLARRPGLLDGIQAGRVRAGRPRGDQSPLPPAPAQRQPVLRIAVQDVEVSAGLPQDVRHPRAGQGLLPAVLRLVTTWSTVTPGSPGTPPPASTTAPPTKSASSGLSRWTPPTTRTQNDSCPSHPPRHRSTPRSGSTSPKRRPPRRPETHPPTCLSRDDNFRERGRLARGARCSTSADTDQCSPAGIDPHVRHKSRRWRINCPLAKVVEWVARSAQGRQRATCNVSLAAGPAAYEKT